MFVTKTRALALVAAASLAAAVACSGSTATGAAQPDPAPTLGAVQSTDPEGAQSSKSPGKPPVKPTGRPPTLDRSVASVGLDEVLFDTFRGGSIPLDEASEQTIDGLRDAIVPIYEPRYDGVDGGDWLDGDDVVLGYVSETGAYAYPVKMLNLHEIVNDVIDGVPVLVCYCPLCASGVVYSRLLDGRELVFGNTSALYESDLVIFDWETGSYWHQVIGDAIVGPLTGSRLTPLPSRMTTWSRWKTLYPNTRVLSKDLGLLRGGVFGGNPYDRDPFLGYAERVNDGRFAFPVSPDKLDARLRPGDLVLALEVDGVHVAYPLSRDEPMVINGEISGRPVVILTDPKAPSGVAFFTDVLADGGATGRILTFEPGPGGSLRDAETASSWDATGRATSGALLGTTLEPVPSRTSFWFSIVGAVPDIELRLPQGG